MATPKKAAAAPKLPAESIALEAIEPLRIDGVDVAPGEPFTASPEVAAGLVASGAAQEPAE